MLNAKLGLALAALAALMTLFAACSKEEVEEKLRSEAAKGFQSTIDGLKVDEMVSKAKEKGGDELTGLAGQAESKMSDIKGMLAKLTSGEGKLDDLKDKLGEAVPALKDIIEKIQSALK